MNEPTLRKAPTLVVRSRSVTGRAAQAEQTRQSIVSTAQRLFTEHGYDATSLQLIADETGVTKAAVYYYFPTKAEILHAVVSVTLEQLHTLVEAAAAQPSRRARSQYLIEGYIDLLIRTRHIAAPKNSDPAIQRELATSGQIVDLERRGLQVLFGDSPTAEQRVAYLLVLAVREIMTGLDDLGDDDLRAALIAVCLRLQRSVS